MPGILGIVTNHTDLDDLQIDYLSLLPFDCKKKTFEHLRFERFTNAKFLNDKVFEEDDEILIGVEGVIFNYVDLRAKFKAESNFILIKKMYQQNEDSFFNDFRGEFSGFVYDKRNKTIHIYTNHTASKPIFYFFEKEMFMFSSEVKVITQVLNKFRKKPTLDETGAYFLLTYGFMLHDFTLVKNVRKLLPGHYIKIELSPEQDNEISYKHEIRPYFRFTNNEISGESKDEIIDNIDAKFKHAVMQEYNKDLEYDYKHIATLSGGLDSRMSVLIANKLGFKDITTMTFSESNYWDERIAKQIAHDNGFEFLFMSLDHGNYLKNIDPAVLSNDGHVLYAGAVHHHRMTNLINPKNFGLQHTGMLGDAILGTYLKKNQNDQVNLGDGAYSQRLIQKIKSEFNEIVPLYSNLELYKLYNRGFNGIFNGFWMTQQFTEFGSAFLDVDLLSYTLSIPAKYKLHEQIYIDWIRSKHRDIGKYKWERTLTSVNMRQPVYRIVGYSLRFIIKHLKRRLHLTRLYSMNPFEYWFRNNKSIREYVSKVYDENINNLDAYKELKQDCIGLFTEGKPLEQTQALTLLRAFELLNLR